MKQIHMTKPALVLAEEIEQGECFRKKTGTYIYMRISGPAVKHDIEKGVEGPDQSSIYGACLLNGNMCKVEKHKEVWREEVRWVHPLLED